MENRGQIIACFLLTSDIQLLLCSEILLSRSIKGSIVLQLNITDKEI